MTEGDTSQLPPPLAGVRVVHLAAIGPAPYATMLLADLGCDVIIIDRPTAGTPSVPPAGDPRRRGQRSIVLDLKDEDDHAVLLRLILGCDVLIEGMRPGVLERLDLAPERCCDLNPRLIYARMTGWGQEGPLANLAGHDINYVALSGALHAMGDADRPPSVPLNLLGDYGGGGMFLVVGILAALLERASSGRGQVVDGAIVDGVASLTAATFGMAAAGRWSEQRASNAFDGSKPWYRTYRTRDGRFVAVGALEDPFFDALLQGLGLDPDDWSRDDPSTTDRLAAQLERAFASQDRDYWEARFAGSDACVSPVLTFAEAASHPHAVARKAYQEIGGVRQPAPGPRLSRTPALAPHAPSSVGAHTASILQQLDDGGVDVDWPLAK